MSGDNRIGVLIFAFIRCLHFSTPGNHLIGQSEKGFAESAWRRPTLIIPEKDHLDSQKLPRI
jgi:hypothetical protein